MSHAPTLNSRLRVLVAKTFRAEQLYGSIRGNQGGQATNLSVLSEMANDIRAKEWQRSHAQLRTALNDLMERRNNSTLGEEVASLRNSFQAKADESMGLLAKGTEALLENAKRCEFAHILKLSVELVRHKASAQANRVVAEELTAVLEATGRGGLQGGIGEEESTQIERAINDGFSDDFVSPQFERSNVIPLTRRLASGGGRRR